MSVDAIVAVLDYIQCRAIPLCILVYPNRMSFRYSIATRAEPTIVESQRAVTELSSGRQVFYFNRILVKYKKDLLCGYCVV